MMMSWRGYKDWKQDNMVRIFTCFKDKNNTLHWLMREKEQLWLALGFWPEQLEEWSFYFWTENDRGFHSKNQELFQRLVQDGEVKGCALTRLVKAPESQ